VGCVGYWARKESWWGLGNGSWDSGDEIHFLIRVGWDGGWGI
jgi:hypothetical protein